MLETQPTSSLSSDLLGSFREQLQEKLSSYNNESAAYASFERYSGLSRKTLKGFLEHARRPYPNTLIAFNKWLFKTEDEQFVVSQLSAEVRSYLVKSGYNLSSQKKDMTNLVCKTSIHTELYLLTEDHQIIKRSEIVAFFGQRGLEALNELVFEGIIQALDEESYTAGLIRACDDVKFYKETTKMIQEMCPWTELALDPGLSDVGVSAGNLIISDQDEDELNRLLLDLRKKLCVLHEKGLKLPQDKQRRYVFSTLFFRPSLERGLL